MKRIPSEILNQVGEACKFITTHFSSVRAIYLYGSALHGGLKRESDIDLLVILDEIPEDDLRKAFLQYLLTISSPPGNHNQQRPLEITVLALPRIESWVFPLTREVQFGEWLRKDIQAEIYEPPMEDYDLAILLTKAREISLPLLGPEIKDLFPSVPQSEFIKTLRQTLKIWNAPQDWTGDERNVLLTLARILYSAETGLIASKDEAASWVLERIPKEYQSTLRMAQEGYQGLIQDIWQSPQEVQSFINYMKLLIEERIKQKRIG